jgi:iron(III) transport system ATP-binding protein
VSAISIRHLSKRFQGQGQGAPALADLSVDVASSTFFTLLGPSGCGKSTLLRCIAGLEMADDGEIEIDGTLVFSRAKGINVPANRRRIGMVFQSYAIWPHMSVLENVSFPLEIQRSRNVRKRAIEALALVGLEQFADRNASQLSGGQQQRVALARAIVAEPNLLLLDEPLSNLDAALREQMRAELQTLQSRLRTTTIYVTHDQVEALSLSDIVAVMRNGRFVEVATPEQLYAEPRTAFAARFVGGANVFACRGSRGGHGTIETALGALRASRPPSEAESCIFIRPERIKIAEVRPTDAANVLQCVLKGRRFTGEATEFDLVVPDRDGDVSLCARTFGATAAAPGARVWAVIDPKDIHFVADG